MRFIASALGLTAAFSVASVVSPAGSQPKPPHASPWPGCCGVATWPQGRAMMSGGQGGMMGGGQGMMGGSMARNHAAMTGAIPADYANARNPLPRTPATVKRGGQVYAANCASCHGPTGLGTARQPPA